MEGQFKTDIIRRNNLSIPYYKGEFEHIKDDENY